MVSAIAFVVFVGLVAYVTITKVDVQPELGGHAHIHAYPHPAGILAVEPE